MKKGNRNPSAYTLLYLDLTSQRPFAGFYIAIFPTFLPIVLNLLEWAMKSGFEENNKTLKIYQAGSNNPG
jgi:hypothetical protein